MSIDFSLEQVQPTEVFSSNMTHNVSKMWTRAGCYDAVYMSEGIQAKHALPFLEKGYQYMLSHSEEFEKMNPENGWGSYDSAIQWLRRLRDACTQYPESIIHISK